jgi:hypothetical protein
LRPWRCQRVCGKISRITIIREKTVALNDQEIAIVKGMIARGDRQHDIAAYFGENGGRIGEINTGKRGELVDAAPPHQLPPAGPYMAGRSALRARETLIALRELIDEAIGEIDLYEGAAEKGDRG